MRRGIIFLVLIVATGVSWHLFHYFESCLQTPLRIQEKTLFEVKQGTSGYQVVSQLDAKGWLPYSPYVAKLWLKTIGKDVILRRGTYELVPQSTLLDVFLLLSKGKEFTFAVTIIEGMTWRATLDALVQHPHLVNDLTLWNEHQFLAQWVDINGGVIPLSPEGLLLADTYYFTSGTPVSRVLERASQALLSALQTMWSERQEQLPLSLPYESLVLASIIEKETALAHERPLIAGVFTQRLRIGMRLQTDPTVIYGIKDFDGNITKQHLRTYSPYNTYVIHGLPPTPIAISGKAAIRAALHPADTDALYFVARGDGSHVFSSNLVDHNKAVAQFQRGTDGK